MDEHDISALLGRQSPSGLWDEGDGTADDDVRQLQATARALLDLLDADISTRHPRHGSAVVRAVDGLMETAPDVAAREPLVAELALGVAWLVAASHRKRRQVELVVGSIRELKGMRVWLADEHALRARLACLRG